MKLEVDEATPVSVVLANPSSYDGKYLRLEGEVVSVCAKKGCWLRLGPGDPEQGQSIFVKFTCPISGRLVPMEAVGYDAIVEGTLAVEVITEDDARHYAEDAGKSPEEIAKITGDQHQLRMASPAARILGMDPVVSPEGKAGPTTRPAGS